MRLYRFAFTVSPEERDHARSALQQLTSRERDVLHGLLKAHSSKRIAEDLGISHRTVEVYRGRLNDKVGARTTTDLLRILAGVVPYPAHQPEL